MLGRINIIIVSLFCYLLVTQVVHPGRHVDGELQQLLGGEGGGRSVLLGEDRVRLQHPALPQEVQQVPVGSVLYGDVQVAWDGRRDRAEGREMEFNVVLMQM